MKRRWIVRVALLAMTLALLAWAAGAEGFDAVPTASVTLGKGETLAIDTSSILAAPGQVLKYKTTDDKVAVVDGEGVITARKKGDVTIGVGYDQTLLGLVKVTVTGAPKRVALSEDMVVLSVGDSVTLEAALSKESASALSYSSSNLTVASVDGDGKVTALAGGKATVTVETFNGHSDSCDVYVLGGKAPTTLSLNVSNVIIQVGETFKLEPSVDEGSDALYAFASQDKRVARVSDDGVIGGVRTGETLVAVRTHNGLTQLVNVTVKPKRKDVYGCLTNDPSEFARIATRLKLVRDLSGGEEAGVVGRDDELVMAMTSGACRVAVSATADPRYCVQGVDVSMSPEDAVAKLIANGWAQTAVKSGDGTEQRVFTKGGDTTHTVTLASNGAFLTGISAQWSW